MADGRERLLQAQRVEASDLELDWPERLRIKQLAIRQPQAVVERDQAGEFPLARLGSLPGSRSMEQPPSETGAVAATPPRPSLGVAVGEVLVQDGAVEWRDRTVTPPVRVTLSDLTATGGGASWPVTGPIQLHLAGRPTGGGQVEVSGHLGLTPFTADARLTTRAVDLAPYQPYLPTPARISAWADLDLAVAMPRADAIPTARGSAALSRIDIRDGERTVLRVERAAVTGLEVEWPRRVAAARLSLEAPWILVERDEHGAMGMKSLLPAGDGGAPPSDRAVPAGVETPRSLAVTVAHATVDGGGARFVDRSVSPAVALDLSRLALRSEGVSTVPGSLARVDFTGQAGPRAALALRGTVGPLGGPLRVDLSGEFGEFAVPRANSYMVRHIGWQASEGLLTVHVQCRIAAEALDARADIQLSRLQVARAAPNEATGGGVGLPLNLIVALMRDSRGDIRVSIPVGGRLNDPRFDFRDAIRSAIRTVAVKAITLPVSWIGRLHVSPDSSVEQVQVDPIRFQVGEATFTPDGQTQAMRVAAFLEQVGEVRMALTPVVSGRDLATLRRRAAEAAVERLAGDARISREAAARRLLSERRPDRPVPIEPAATLDALADDRGLARPRV